ncbi:MAG: thrombospondin type 3 repeat-containing protein [Candidatus Micrarchaeota archaeon]|nr:thrombospondin type 3 repeat-containing protein [Candidatus Micrarchaeota archaeon]
MQNANHSHKPQNAVLQRVVNAFATKGIRLHIDTGQWSGGNSVPEQPLAAWHELNFINNSEKPNYLANNRYLFDIKKDNFNSKRISIFYYGIFVHERSDSSGQAEVGGNFFVALPFDDTIAAKSGTLMHEFGHTLQLGHGGRLDNEFQYDNTQFKPNYRSIMNYHFQFNGIPRINQSGAIVYDLDYSEEALADLNESAGLSEANGLISQDPTTVSFYSCVNAGHGLNAPDVMYSSGSNLVPWFVLNGSSVDWDCDGAITGSPKISVNGFDGSQFNNSGPLEFMAGRSDWDKVVLKIGCGDYGLESEITDENRKRVGRLWGNCSELTDIRASLGYSGELDNPTLPPRYPFLGEACDGVDNNGNRNIDEGCSDSDNDGVVDDLDNCPELTNADQRDSNNDFVGDACASEYFFNKNTTVSAESSENVQGEQTEIIQNEVRNGLVGEDSQNQSMEPLGWLNSLIGFDFGSILLALGAAVLIGGILIILLIVFVLKKLLRK